MVNPYQALREFFPDLDIPDPSESSSQTPVTETAPTSSIPPIPATENTTFPPARVPTRPKRPRAKRKLFEEPKFAEDDLFHISNLFITRCEHSIQISCMVTIRPSSLSFAEAVPVAMRATQKKLLTKLQEKYPNRDPHLRCIRLDHAQLTANHEMFVHLKDSTDLGSIVLQQIERCLSSDRKVNFEESFRVVLIAQF